MNELTPNIMNHGDLSGKNMAWPSALCNSDLSENAIWLNSGFLKTAKSNGFCRLTSKGEGKRKCVDRVQICAQTFCLEEMFHVSIDSGQLYYLQEHRRKNVFIVTDLRKTTEETIAKARAIWNSETAPKAEYEKQKCDRCSLFDLCMPKYTGIGNKNVDRYIQSQL
jgi:sulfatase maturation enzyme AslB (radical SAM superfamily)